MYFFASPMQEASLRRLAKADAARMNHGETANAKEYPSDYSSKGLV